LPSTPPARAWAGPPATSTAAVYRPRRAACSGGPRRPQRASTHLRLTLTSRSARSMAGMARLELERLCEEFEAPVPSPSGGSAAAAVAAIAASLVVMVGRGSPEWSDGPDAAVAAAALRDRLLALAGEDVEAVAVVLAASRIPSGSGSGDGQSELVRALVHASQVPLEIAERAADVAALAGSAAQEGKRPMRADAAAAAALAVAATQVALSIVGGNLTAPGLPLQEMERLSEAARLASERVGLSPQPLSHSGRESMWSK
jgi:formiminotetrahydrofolate cyclodeaminase